MNIWLHTDLKSSKHSKWNIFKGFVFRIAEFR